MLDQITNLLHRELARKLRQSDGHTDARTTAASPASRQHAVHVDSRAALRVRIDRLSAAGITDEAVLIRAVAEHLLRDEFGDALANSAPFHAIADQITHAAFRLPEFKAMLLAVVEYIPKPM